MTPIVKAIFTIVEGGTVYISDAAYIRQIKTDMNETITINFLFFIGLFICDLSYKKYSNYMTRS
jgi:hypothetical protein